MGIWKTSRSGATIILEYPVARAAEISHHSAWESGKPPDQGPQSFSNTRLRGQQKFRTILHGNLENLQIRGHNHSRIPGCEGSRNFAPFCMGIWKTSRSGATIILEYPVARAAEISHHSAWESGKPPDQGPQSFSNTRLRGQQKFRTILHGNLENLQIRGHNHSRIPGCEGSRNFAPFCMGIWKTSRSGATIILEYPVARAAEISHHSAWESGKPPDQGPQSFSNTRLRGQQKFRTILHGNLENLQIRGHNHSRIPGCEGSRNFAPFCMGIWKTSRSGATIILEYPVARAAEISHHSAWESGKPPDQGPQSFSNTRLRGQQKFRTILHGNLENLQIRGHNHSRIPGCEGSRNFAPFCMGIWKTSRSGATIILEYPVARAAEISHHSAWESGKPPDQGPQSFSNTRLRGQQKFRTILHGNLENLQIRGHNHSRIPGCEGSRNFAPFCMGIWKTSRSGATIILEYPVARAAEISHHSAWESGKPPDQGPQSFSNTRLRGQQKFRTILHGNLENLQIRGHNHSRIPGCEGSRNFAPFCMGIWKTSRSGATIILEYPVARAAEISHHSAWESGKPPDQGPQSFSNTRLRGQQKFRTILHGNLENLQIRGHNHSRIPGCEGSRNFAPFCMGIWKTSRSGATIILEYPVARAAEISHHSAWESGKPPDQGPQSFSNTRLRGQQKFRTILHGNLENLQIRGHNHSRIPGCEGSRNFAPFCMGIWKTSRSGATIILEYPVARAAEISHHSAWESGKPPDQGPQSFSNTRLRGQQKFRTILHGNLENLQIRGHNHSRIPGCEGSRNFAPFCMGIWKTSRSGATIILEYPVARAAEISHHSAWESGKPPDQGPQSFSNTRLRGQQKFRTILHGNLENLQIRGHNHSRIPGCEGSRNFAPFCMGIWKTSRSGATIILEYPVARAAEISHHSAWESGKPPDQGPQSFSNTRLRGQQKFRTILHGNLENLQIRGHNHSRIPGCEGSRNFAPFCMGIWKTSRSGATIILEYPVARAAEISHHSAWESGKPPDQGPQSFSNTRLRGQQKFRTILHGNLENLQIRGHNHSRIPGCEGSRNFAPFCMGIWKTSRSGATIILEYPVARAAEISHHSAWESGKPPDQGPQSFSNTRLRGQQKFRTILHGNLENLQIRGHNHSRIPGCEGSRNFAPFCMGIWKTSRSGATIILEYPVARAAEISHHSAWESGKPPDQGPQSFSNTRLRGQQKFRTILHGNLENLQIRGHNHSRIPGCEGSRNFAPFCMGIWKTSRSGATIILEYPVARAAEISHHSAWESGKPPDQGPQPYSTPRLRGQQTFRTILHGNLENLQIRGHNLTLLPGCEGSRHFAPFCMGIWKTSRSGATTLLYSPVARAADISHHSAWESGKPPDQGPQPYSTPRLRGQQTFRTILHGNLENLQIRGHNHSLIPGCEGSRNFAPFCMEIWKTSRSGATTTSIHPSVRAAETIRTSLHGKPENLQIRGHNLTLIHGCEGSRNFAPFCRGIWKTSRSGATTTSKHPIVRAAETIRTSLHGKPENLQIRGHNLTLIHGCEGSRNFAPFCRGIWKTSRSGATTTSKHPIKLFAPGCRGSRKTSRSGATTTSKHPIVRAAETIRTSLHGNPENLQIRGHNLTLIHGCEGSRNFAPFGMGIWKTSRSGATTTSKHPIVRAAETIRTSLHGNPENLQIRGHNLTLIHGCEGSRNFAPFGMGIWKTSRSGATTTSKHPIKLFAPVCMGIRKTSRSGATTTSKHPIVRAAETIRTSLHGNPENLQIRGHNHF
eukprot:sb/3460683/